MSSSSIVMQARDIVNANRLRTDSQRLLATINRLHQLRTIERRAHRADVMLGELLDLVTEAGFSEDLQNHLRAAQKELVELQRMLAVHNHGKQAEDHSSL